MINYANSRKSQGVSFRFWVQRVMELYSESTTHSTVNKQELQRMYDADFSYEEALLKDRTKGFMNVYLELNIKHEFGYFKTTFKTDEQAKVFFSKFPEVREELRMKQWNKTRRKNPRH